MMNKLVASVFCLLSVCFGMGCEKANPVQTNTEAPAASTVEQTAGVVAEEVSVPGAGAAKGTADKSATAKQANAVAPNAAPAEAVAKADAEKKVEPAPEGKQPLPRTKGALVTNPESGSPEAVIKAAMVAAMEKDEIKGWAAFSSLLHSYYNTPVTLKSWRSFNYPAFRRKVKLYLPEDTKPVFALDRVEKIGDDTLKIFVVNERSMPTPCTLKKDPQAKDAWRIHTCSL